MGFGVNSYAKIKEVKEQQENYTVCKISIIKKTKESHTTVFMGYVKFIGNAHKQRPMADQKIKITSCDVTNCYVKDEVLCFNKQPQYVIFGYELQEDGNNGTTAASIESAYELLNDNSDIPF